MPVLRSTVYSCGIAWSSSRSCGIACARATSFARSTSCLRISSPLTATIPLLVIACTCSPAMPAYSSCTWLPAIRSASCNAFRIDRVVSSMSETTPRRIPVVRAWPTPSTLTVGCFGRSPTASAMMAVVFADPMSSPATMRSGFMGVWRSPGLGSEDRSRPHAPGAVPDPPRRERFRQDGRRKHRASRGQERR